MRVGGGGGRARSCDVVQGLGSNSNLSPTLGLICRLCWRAGPGRPGGYPLCGVFG